MTKILRENSKKYMVLMVLSVVITFGYHNWLPGHKVEFSNSYVLHFIADTLFGFVLFLITWEANLRVNLWLDRYLKWEHSPVKRLILQITLNTVHTFLLMVLIISTYTFALTFLIPAPVRDAQAVAYPVLQRSLYAFVAILVVYQIIYISFYFFRQWSNTLVESERLKRENLSSQLQALQVQVNPHFLFNSLSSLVSLIEEDKVLAVEFVQELASVYRYLLQQKTESLIKICEELNFIRSFIYLHKARCGDNLKAEIKIDKEYMNYLVPPQTLQILVENAIKHNIISGSRPLTIKIYNNNDRHLIVENNLQKKISDHKHTETGLSNIADRYRLLSRQDIKIESNNGIFRVTVPMIRPDGNNESTDN